MDPKEDRFISRRIEDTRTGVRLDPLPPFPRNIMVELSNACNHKCIFCANPKMTRRIGRIDEGLLLRILEDAHQLGSREVGFYTTGDPLIHKNLIPSVRDAKKIGYTYTYISTNGALATEAKMEALVEAGIDSVKFSINAGDRETYRKVHGRDDWQTVVGNVKYISWLRDHSKQDFKLGITYVVTTQNKDQIKSFHDDMIRYVDDIYFSGCGVQGGNMVDNEGLLNAGIDVEVMRYRAPCHMLFSRAHITCEGYLTLCCVDYQNYLAVCDLKNIPLEAAWGDELFQKMRKHHLTDDLEGTLCYNCINSTATPIRPLREDLATVVEYTW